MKRNNDYIKEKNIRKNSQITDSEDYFISLDEYLDNKSNGPFWLSNPEIARLVYDSIMYRDGKDYKLICFCIMGNHVHLMIYKLNKQLHKIMQQLKSYTALEANKIIRRIDNIQQVSQYTDHFNEDVNTDLIHSKNRIKHKPVNHFWQAESFDRLVRNRNDMANKILYTLNNPVKAGLISNWKEWKYSYCRNEFLEI